MTVLLRIDPYYWQVLMNFDDLPVAFLNLEVRPTARSKGHDALAQCGDGAHGFLTGGRHGWSAPFLTVPPQGIRILNPGNQNSSLLELGDVHRNVSLVLDAS